MQVVQHWISLAVALWLGLLSGAQADETLSEFRPRPLGWALDALRNGDWDTAKKIAARDGIVASDLIEWQRLQAGRGSYEDVSAFLLRRADWPGLNPLRKAAERVVIQQDDATILNFFLELPAQTAAGVLAHAKALTADGRKDQAEALVKNAWLNFALSDTQQADYLETHGTLLKPLIAERLDAMIWKGWQDNARRLLPLVSDGEKALTAARIAFARRAGNVDTLLAKVPESLQDHPGLAHARFEWRVRKGRWSDAKELILAQSASKETLGRPGAWSNRRRELARDELRDGTAKRAYQMAANHHLASGSHYADLEWLSGYIALTRLNDPATALQHFKNHDAAVASPISKGRAGYWQGRAHRALGDFSSADQAFTKGAAYQTSFYGLLAAEAAGLPFDVGLQDIPQEPWKSSPLESDSLFQAGILLAASGERNLAERFWVHLAEQLGEHDAALLGQAAIDLNEPHLAVMIGKAVARRGATVPAPYYPLHPLAKAKLPVNADLALAIARRESEFDPVVVSGVGARGLMQLMPKTAAGVAKDLGISEDHSTDRLTSDPVYNAVLGTQYLAELAGRFDGNIVMVSAAYNAGPSRPNRWMNEYGDPRSKDIDAMIDWIEGIPFRETRNYVMRVSESLPIFRARLGQDPLPVPFSTELLGNTLSQ